jgi:hypothetical protein
MLDTRRRPPAQVADLEERRRREAEYDRLYREPQRRKYEEQEGQEQAYIRAQAAMLAQQTGLDLEDARLLYLHRQGSNRLTWGETQRAELLEEQLARLKVERAMAKFDRGDDIERRWEEADAKRARVNGKAHDQPAATPPPPPLPYISMASWDTDPVPDQDWTVLDRIPRRQGVLFSGEGAAGKSTLQLHLCAAHVLGRDWLGTMPEAPRSSSMPKTTRT